MIYILQGGPMDGKKCEIPDNFIEWRILVKHLMPLPDFGSAPKPPQPVQLPVARYIKMHNRDYSRIAFVYDGTDS